MIFNIFKKELIDTLRDKRSVRMMVIIPLLVFPVMLNLILFSTKKIEENQAEKTMHIGLIKDKSNFLTSKLKQLSNNKEKQLLFYKDSLQLINALNAKKIQVALVLESTFEKKLKTFQPARIHLISNDTELGFSDRMNNDLLQIEEQLKKERFQQLKINETTLQPLDIKATNIASSKEMIGKLAGGFLPYIFITFGFMGCMYPAIDLFTGEKERGTLETLLTAPVARWRLLVGKLLVIVVAGLISASCGFLGLFFEIEVFGFTGEPEIATLIHSILSLKFIFSLYLLLIPLIVFIAGLLVPIAIYAKSFKEAQSMIAPLNFVIIIPVMIGFLPGIEYNFATASIPIINIVLATKELIAGTLTIGLMAWSFFVMLSFAALAVLFSYKRFDKENAIL
jgi:sodium transport system permease protein